MTRFRVLFLLLLTVLTGCGQAETAAPPTETPTPPPAEESAPPTEADVLDFFTADPNNDGCEATDCVLADDGAYDLIGVVQYTNEDGNPCYLSFVDRDGFCLPVGICASGELEIATSNVLTYLGSGAVSLVLKETATDALLDYVVEFSRLEDGVNFKLSSQEHC